MPLYKAEELIEQVKTSPQTAPSASSVARYLGEDAFIQVYDQDGKLVSSAGQSSDAFFLTPDEIRSLSMFEEGFYFDVMEYKDERNQPMVLVKQQVSDETEYEKNRYFVLDKDLHILYQSKPSDKTSFTKRELEILSGIYTGERDLYHERLTGADGKTYFTLYAVTKFSEKEYLLVLGFIENIWIFLAFFYLLFVAVSIVWLNKKTKSLLRPLDESILHLLANEPSQPIAYDGPREFVEIYSRFNDLTRRLGDSEKQRQALDEAKEKMMTNISHDLKTPITVIQGYAKAIRDDLVPIEQQPRYLETIYQKSAQLTKLINSFFEYSKLKHPSMPLSLKRMNITDFFTQYLAQKYQEMELAGYSLEVDIPEKRIYGQADQLLLTRAFDNLIANVLQHNPQGTTLNFQLEEKEETIEITFADDGIGISSPDRKNFFEPFVIADEARGGKAGSGLGLAITETIIAMHGGTIVLDEPEGKWKTKFLIRLACEK